MKIMILFIDPTNSKIEYEFSDREKCDKFPFFPNVIRHHIPSQLGSHLTLFFALQISSYSCDLNLYLKQTKSFVYLCLIRLHTSVYANDG